MINLLPSEEKKNLIGEENWKLTIILGILILASLICFSLILFSIKIFISGEIGVQKTFLNLEEKEFKNSQIQTIEKKIIISNEKLSRLDYFYKNQVNLTEILEKISGTLPPETHLISLGFNPLVDSKEEKYLAQISLSGFSSTREVLLRFKENLEKEEGFSEINFRPADWLEKTNINFLVIFKAK